MGWGLSCFEEKRYSNSPDYCKKKINPFGCKKLFFPEIDLQSFSIKKEDTYDYNPLGYFRINKKEARATFYMNKDFFKDLKEQFENYKDCPVFPFKDFKEAENIIEKHLTQIPSQLDLKSKDIIIETAIDQYVYVKEIDKWININDPQERYKNLTSLPDPISSIIYVPLKPIYKGTWEANKENRIEGVRIKVKDKSEISAKGKKSFLSSFFLSSLFSVTQLLWFISIGWWLGLAWIALSIGIMFTIIGIPIGIKMLKKAPVFFALTKRWN